MAISKNLLFSFLLLFSLASSAIGLEDNDTLIDAGRSFWGSIVVDPCCSARSAASIQNPITSGKNVYVDRIVLAHGNVNQSDGCDIRILSAQWGSLQGTLKNKNVSAPNSTAQLRWGNLHSYELPTPPYFECWMGSKSNDHTYEFVPAIKLPPGYGLMIPSSSDGVGISASFQIREY